MVLMESSSDVTSPILHVVVVGFHHKKGCQVTFIRDDYQELQFVGVT